MRRLIHLTILQVALFAVLTSVSASCQASDRLTMKEAVEKALEENLDVLSAREDLVKAEGNYRSVRSSLLPSIGITGTQYQYEGAKDGFESSRKSTGKIALNQAIDVGGSLRAGERQALVQIRQAEENLADRKNSLSLEVCEAFTEVIRLGSNLKTAEEAFNYSKNSLAELQKKRELGLATGLEVSRSEQQMESDRADLIGAENDLQIARVDLFTLMRLPPDSDFDVDDEIELDISSSDRDSSLDEALMNRSDLKSLISEKESQAQNVTLAAAGMKPSLELSAGWSYGDDNSSSNADDNQWFASLSLEIPLYDGGQTDGKIEQEKAALTQADQAVTKKEEAIRSEITQAWLNIASTAETVTASKKNVALAEESLRLAEVGYKEGVNIQIDVLQALTDLTEARQNLASALKDYRIAIITLWDKEGRLPDEMLKGVNHDQEEKSQGLDG